MNVLHILHSVSNMDRAGVETMLMNYYRHMDRDRIQFDFLMNRKKPGDYDGEIRALGGRIFISPGLSPAKYPAYMAFMARLLGEHPEIRALHAHNEGMAFYALRGAQRAGLPVRIAHAHNTRFLPDYKWPLKMACKTLLPLAATELCACGTDSGVFFFGKRLWRERGRLIPNAIDVQRFRYQEALRAQVRRAYGLGDAPVIGHVGRMSPQKNHRRLLRIFAACLARVPQAWLVLIGVGELEAELRTLARRLNIAERTLFLGLREDTHAWYQAMDVLLMPSLFEGLPVVGVEAQAAGLPCVFSDAVTPEALLLAQSCRLPLSAPDGVWADRIVRLCRSPLRREEGAVRVADAGYDIVREAKRLQAWYLALTGEEETGGA